LDDMENYLHNFIFWVAAMDDGSNKVDLIDRKMLIRGELEIGRRLSLINPEDEVTKRNIGFMLKNDKENKGKDFNEFKTRGLNAVELRDKRIANASSKFINIFYEGAVKYCKLNYNIN
ncbi:MAG TPA: hypothetical protein VEZ17_12940, partial [Chitinophagaceae bacterium]|nr:hypothetical protein [Chitinophagaceae bacterium]